MKSAIYLDHAAATPLDQAVLDAMQPYFSDKFYNPSSLYLTARQVASDVMSARKKVAIILGVRSSEVIFTAGGTEANNLAIDGVMRQFPSGNLVVSAIEHPSVLEPAKQYQVREAAVTRAGIVDINNLEKCIDDQTVLVSIMYVNNEIGTIQPLKQVAALLKRIKATRQKSANPLPLYFHTDACQAAAWLDLYVNQLGVDMMTINGGKIYGPKQSGALFIKTGVKLSAQMLGGGQEQNLRSGTENVPQVIGFAKALELVQGAKLKEGKRQLQLQTEFITSLRNRLPNVVINGSLERRVPNNLHVTFPGVDNEWLMMALDEKGIMCGVGSACSASDESPSHVLMAIGVSESDARSSLRFSMGRATTSVDVATTVKVLSQVAKA